MEPRSLSGYPKYPGYNPGTGSLGGYVTAPFLEQRLNVEVADCGTVSYNPRLAPGELGRIKPLKYRRSEDF